MTLPPDDADDAIYYVFTDAGDTDSTTIGDSYSLKNNTIFDIFMEQLAMTLNVYYTPALIVLGCLGNLISLIVFFKSKLRVQSTSQYLKALALSDTLFLCQLLPPWLKAVGASTLFSRDGYCQLFVYLSYVTCNHSSWLVVAFTIERFVAVVYPLQRNAMCTVKRARYIIASLAVTSLLINIPVIRFAVPGQNDCNIDELLIAHAARFNLVDTVVSFTLPLAVIVVLNTWIMWGVYRVSRARPNLVRQHRHGRTRATHQARASACQRSQQRVTRMLLIVSSVFVLLNLPAYTMRIVAYAKNMGEHEYSGKWAALQQVCLLFFNTNFGINFFLYCMTGQNFRRALLETFPWLRRRPRGLPMALRSTGAEQGRASSISTTSFGHSFSTNYTEASHCGGNTIVATHLTCRGGQPAVLTVDGRNYRSTRNVLDNAAATAAAARPSRFRRQPKVIQRWTFDNSRQQRRESIELDDLPTSNI